MNNSLIGKQLANFRLEHLLGQGGMAEVYFGRDISLQRPVAIKVINARFRDDPGYAERFISEARAVASWRHENIVQVYYADKQDGLYYFVMEYVDGMDLASLLGQYATAKELIPHADVIRIGWAVAGALDYAHRKGVIHRDVKPANTMISTDGRVVLMDFGLALDVQQGSIGEVFGTPHYVAPEQARHSADARPQSDVYSLGIMLFEMLTGIVPFDDPSPTAVALQHLTTPPPSLRSLNPSLNQQTEDVILRALEKDPADRYQTASELLTALEAALKVPDAVVSKTDDTLPPPHRSISGRTISEHLALNIQRTLTQAAPDVPRIPATEKPEPPSAPSVPPSVAAPMGTVTSSGRSRSQLLIGAGLIGGAIIIAFMVLLSGGDRGTQLAADATIAQSTDVPPTATDVPPTATDAPPTATDVPPTATDVPPTATDVPPTATDAPPTATDVPPTATDVPPTATDVPPTEIPVLLPTVLFPDGRRVVLLWNNTSFYWSNPTRAAIRVSPMDFEALDAAGNPVGIFFDGIRWTLGFNTVEPGKCVGIELLQTSGYLRPSECSSYNSNLTLQQTSSEVFWLDRNGATQFRVLWEGREVGRCSVAAQSCEVRIPS